MKFLNKQRSVFERVFLCIKERRLPNIVENLLFSTKRKLGIAKYKSIVVETSSLCNVRCVWCWMYYFNKKEIGLMTLENFKKFIDINEKYLRKSNTKITPFNRGEPLIHPNFFEMIDYGRKKRIEFSGINTNLSVKIDTKKLMSLPLSFILVNIGGTTKEIHEKIMKGSKFDLVVNNLRQMLRINNTKVYLKMNVTKDNVHQIKELNSFFKSLGGDKKNIITGSLGFSLPELASEKERKEFLKNTVSDDIRDFLRFYYDKKGNIISQQKNCLFLVPTVNWDGKTTICCHDLLNKLDLGNAFEKPLLEIFNSKKFIDAETKGKNQEFYFCKNCN